MSHYPQCATRRHFYARCNCLVIATEDNARAIREHTRTVNNQLLVRIAELEAALSKKDVS